MNSHNPSQVSVDGQALPAAADGFEGRFQRLKTQLHRELLDSIDLSRIGPMNDAQLRRHVTSLSQHLFRNRPQLLSKIDEERLIDELIAESFGLGPLEPYMQDPEVADILVNGPHEVYVERQGRLFETNTVFADDEHLMQIIQRVVSRVGRRIDSQSPMVDARLADGSRINAVIPPLALNGPTLSIRRFGHTPLDIAMLQAHGSICPEMVAVLDAAIEGRINVMISGGTGSGKTTMLNALSPFIPADERLVTIEDSAELQLRRKHVVRLETPHSHLRGRRRGDRPRPRTQRLADAARSHHPRRSPQRRGPRHAAGHEHGPRGIADDDPRQRRPRRPLALGSHGGHGRLRSAGGRGPPLHRLGDQRRSCTSPGSRAACGG